ncbi:M16 family metallopeptidase [Chondromyces crocatus]|uniref:Zinc protease n=1 Tax=Chondromyces crocatus TaxID=52 RepID=A0A0K1EP41_CHOCO|nr:pitrilysin family protein [Chondromyces crocatus]AKT42574.1 zinc protease [Chondromyces crocatus]
MRFKSTGLWSTLAFLAACANPPPPEAPSSPPAQATEKPAIPAPPDEGFRKTPPPPDPAVAFVPPKIQEARLPNGMRLLLVERRDLPVVAVEISNDRGADQAAPGVGGFVGALLTQGTKTRSAIAFSDAMGRIGARFEARVGHDGGLVGGAALSTHFGELLTLLGDAYMNPAFAKGDVDRERSRRLTSLAQMNDSPASLLGIAVSRALYPANHAYAAPLIGTEKALEKIRQADLAAFHAAYFQPDATTVAIAGDIDREQAIREVERVFGGWKGKAKAAKEPGAPPADASGAKVVILDRPGLTQSTLSVALSGVTRANPDYEAILVMNGLLGGQFTSRLNLNLREKHAYTYGARSMFEMRHGPGPFTAGGAIVGESTGPAVREIFTEIRRIREEPVSAEELSDVKENLIAQLPARFETVGTTANSLSGLAMYRLPLDEYATRAAKLQRVTREDVQRVAQKYLNVDAMRLIMVADAAQVRPQLQVLGLGPISVEAPPGGATQSQGLGAKPGPAGATPPGAGAQPPGAKLPTPTAGPKALPPQPPGKGPPPPPPPIEAPRPKAPRSP